MHKSCNPAHIVLVTHPEYLRYLTPREQHILRLRYNLEGRTLTGLKAIGKHFGVGGERIRQIEKGAFMRLEKNWGWIEEKIK